MKRGRTAFGCNLGCVLGVNRSGASLESEDLGTRRLGSCRGGTWSSGGVAEDMRKKNKTKKLTGEESDTTYTR